MKSWGRSAAAPLVRKRARFESRKSGRGVGKHQVNHHFQPDRSLKTEEQQLLQCRGVLRGKKSKGVKRSSQEKGAQGDSDTHSHPRPSRARGKLHWFGANPNKKRHPARVEQGEIGKGNGLNIRLHYNSIGPSLKKGGDAPQLGDGRKTEEKGTIKTGLFENSQPRKQKPWAPPPPSEGLTKPGRKKGKSVGGKHGRCNETDQQPFSGGEGGPERIKEGGPQGRDWKEGENRKSGLWGKNHGSQAVLRSGVKKRQTGQKKNAKGRGARGAHFLTACGEAKFSANL